MRGRASPHRRRGPNPVPNPGQLSPGRLELLTSSVERCRSRRARIMPGTPSPLALRGARRPGWPGTPDRAAPRPPCRRGTPPCHHSRPPGPHSRAPCTPTPPVAKHPAHDHHRTSNGNLPGSLDNHLLTLVRRECGPAHVPQLSCPERADLARYVLASLWTGHTSRRVYRPAGAGLPAQKGRRSPSGRPGSEPAPRRPGSTRPRPWNCWRPRRRSCARRCAAR